jgi:hypothetical protein
MVNSDGGFLQDQSSTAEPTSGSAAISASQASLAVEPFGVVPRDWHGTDGLESEVWIVGLDKADHAVSNECCAACLACEDVEEELGGASMYWP